MTDIEGRLLALANTKRACFERLKRESPDAAEFLRAVAAEFGRPSGIEVIFRDGKRYRFGEFSKNLQNSSEGMGGERHLNPPEEAKEARNTCTRYPSTSPGSGMRKTRGATGK